MPAESGKSQFGQSTFAGRDYGLEVTLSDGQGWGFLQIAVMHTVGAQPNLIPSCAALGGNCVPADLPDGTRAIVTSGEAARGYPNTGTDLHLTALRPDGTYVTVFCSNLPTEVGPNSIGLLTRPQPPLSQTDLLKFATVFSY